MSQLVPFSFNQQELRTLKIDGEPWFVGKDVAKMLGYTDTSDAINRHCKGSVVRYTIQTAGGMQEVRLLSISDVIRLMLKSKLTNDCFIDKFIGMLKDSSAIIAALQDFEVPDDIPDLYVYAMRNTITGNVKLGISRDPKARLKQLQTGNDCQLELVAYKKANNRFKDESSLHEKYIDNKVRGEWYDLGKISSSFID